MSATPGEDRRAIVHIGWPKTATTSMQQQLRCWPNLAGRPWDRPGGAEAKALLRSFTTGMPDRSGDLDALLDASWHDCRLPVILSDESMIRLPGWGRDPARPCPLDVPSAWRSSTWDRTVVATLRAPRPLLRSAYRQSLRSGDPRAYQHYLADIRADLHAGAGSFTFSAPLEAWAENVGTEHVVIAWYEDYAADAARFWAQLAVSCGVPSLATVGEQGAAHLNRGSHGPWWLERWVNVVLAPHQGKRRSGVGHRLRRVYNHELSHHLPPGRRELGVDCVELEAEVTALMDRELDRVCLRFGERRPTPPSADG